jgi:hypothetical protein
MLYVARTPFALMTWALPFGYPRINIPGLAHYEDGPAQGLDKSEPHDYIDLETKIGKSNMYLTRTLVNPSLVVYIKPGRATPRDNLDHHRLHNS